MAFTSHGHHIPGTDLIGKPDRVARCGGPALCNVCANQAFPYMQNADKEVFERDLASLLNKYSWDTQTNTPDFILADHLVATLETLKKTNNAVKIWKGL